MNNSLLEAFREVYRNLALQPLRSQLDLDKFRVDYGVSALEELEQLVEDSPDGDCKIVFTGHRGCGKSTLLAEFGRRLSHNYFVVFFSIAETIEMSAVDHTNVLFAIAVRLMEEANKQEVTIDTATQKSFYQWFATHTRIEQETFSANLGVGFDLFKFIVGKLQSDATVREEIKQVFTRNISELVAKINQIAAVIQAEIGKGILVIVDDIDKLDLAIVRGLYRDNIKALFQPAFRIIFTIPISAMRDIEIATTVNTEANDECVAMSVTKLYLKGASRQAHSTPETSAIATLREVLNKRIPSHLIEPDTLEEIILYSGGVLRELIRIANECCRICLRLVRKYPDRDLKINHEIFQEAITKIKIDFDTRLNRSDYEVLAKTYQEFMPDNPQDKRFLELLHGLYALEYRNGELWYDVHPFVILLLRERGFIQ